jgi:hypothetical protein
MGGEPQRHIPFLVLREEREDGLYDGNREHEEITMRAVVWAKVRLGLR